MRRTVLLVAAVAACLVMASGVALAVNRVGTNGNDVLRGTDGEDNLVGLGGKDALLGKGGSDNLVGGPGNDFVDTGKGSDNAVLGEGNDFLFECCLREGSRDNIAGGDGNDVVFGGQGADNVVGGDGNDLLIDGNLRESSRDNIAGGDGGDVILVDNVPAFRDVVSCGGGFDRVLADRKDTVARDCERVKIVRGSREEIFEQFDAFIESIPQSFFEGLNPELFG